MKKIDIEKIINYSIENILYKIYRDTGIKIEKENWVGTIPVSEEIKHVVEKQYIDGWNDGWNKLNSLLRKSMNDKKEIY